MKSANLEYEENDNKKIISADANTIEAKTIIITKSGQISQESKVNYSYFNKYNFLVIYKNSTKL